MSDNDNYDFPKPTPGPTPAAVEPAPETVAPEQTADVEVPINRPEELEEGVQYGDLAYTEIEDGQRKYADQKPVETTGDDTPTPEVKAE